MSETRRRNLAVVMARGLMGVGVAVAVGVAQANPDTAEAVCFRAEPLINIGADLTATKCVPTAGTARGRHSFLLISEKPVFSVESYKKPWLLWACGVMGSELTRAAGIRAEALWFSDVERVKRYEAYVIPAARCQEWQAKVKANVMTAEQMYAAMNAVMLHKVLAK